jgi:hypothetical protein
MFYVCILPIKLLATVCTGELFIIVMDCIFVSLKIVFPWECLKTYIALELHHLKDHIQTLHVDKKFIYEMWKEMYAHKQDIKKHRQTCTYTVSDFLIVYHCCGLYLVSLKIVFPWEGFKTYIALELHGQNDSKCSMIGLF